MRLKSLAYSEFEGQAQSWSVKDADVGQICLIVGKNAAGKSRLVNVIHGLARLLSGDFKPFRSGNYQTCFGNDQARLYYDVAFDKGAVVKERLKRDDVELLDRGPAGNGRIWAKELDRQMQFESPTTELAAHVRRDSIQHPFLQELYDWARNVRMYKFGTTLGQNRIMPATSNDLATTIQQLKSRAATPYEGPGSAEVYLEAFHEFGDAFDDAVMNDLRALDYDVTAVGMEPLDTTTFETASGVPALLGLFVQERDLPVHTSQLHMSVGMFRVLSLLIHLNDAVLRKRRGTLLIDDIGEGLDFSRSQNCIRLLIERAIKHDLQLVMTTNDRFVMNGVPLEYWSVIRREGAQVRLVNERNSPALFQEFRELGLNNFDFFSTNFFEQGMK